MSQKTVLVTGGSGLLGTALQSVSTESPHRFVFTTRQEFDLEKEGAAEALLQKVKPDMILHTAAVVGGIRYNMESPEELRDRNRKINESLLAAAVQTKVSKVVSFLSTCIFPQDAPEPWNEKIIHDGETDSRQWGYAQAKRELDLKSRDLTRQTQGQSTFVCLMPSTMYGANDNYDLERSHVLPALIKKVYDAKNGGPAPVFWGSGQPRREFIYSVDVARLALWGLDHYEDTEPLIVAPPDDVSVKELVDHVVRELAYDGPLHWDTAKPDGRLTRRTDTAKLKKLRPTFKPTPFSQGLKVMIADFISHEQTKIHIH